jgi:molecular chaperone DnaK (HSP70)
MAGLKVLKLVSEPMAAAISYGLFVAGQKTVAVFDLGGGTLDVSVLRIEEGTIKALAIGGDNMLGGDDFDLALMKHWLSVVSSADPTRSDLSISLADSNSGEGCVAFSCSLRTLCTSAFVLLKRQCEQAKRMLSIKGKFLLFLVFLCMLTSMVSVDAT